MILFQSYNQTLTGAFDLVHYENRFGVIHIIHMMKKKYNYVQIVLPGVIPGP